MDNLRNVDLNLLVTLEALLTERNVTRAARRLHLSQPSVSVQLRKLREMFGDPLLSAVPGGMAPTTRAQALLPALRSTLADMRRLFRPTGSFEPRTARVTWQVAAADYAEYAILMPLLVRMRRVAPGIRMAVRGVGMGHGMMTRQLDSGGVDLVLMAMDTVPSHLHHAILYREDYVLVGRKGHPALKGRLTLERLRQLDYSIMSPEGGGFRGVTDEVLESLGHRRRVVFSTQHFLFIPELVARTDIVAMVPSRLVRDRSDRLRIVAPPVSIPAYEMAMIWHERSELDPAHEWLRGQVRLSVSGGVGG
jgi:DNA-binding transcriptional LysR family regulator